MQKIALICAVFIVILLAIVGCLYIFDMMSAETSISTALKVGGAIVLLGACSAAIRALMGGNKDQ